jgi:hypothetical protein
VFTLTRIQRAVVFYAILGTALVIAIVVPDTSDGGSY